MQVDWLTGVIHAPPELSPRYRAGTTLKLGPSGDVLAEFPAFHRVEADEDSEGSASRCFFVSTPDACRVRISGNPVKLLQGHNAFGSTDVLGLFFEAGSFIRRHAGLFPGAETWRSCKFQGPDFSRIDLTRSYRFPTAHEAAAWVRTVAGSARSRHGAATLHGGATAVLGEGSRRWSLTIYDKHAETLHRLRKKGDEVPPGVLEWTAGIVRFELRLRGLEIQGIEPNLRAALLSDSDHRAAALAIWSSYFQRVTFNGNAAMQSIQSAEHELPARLRRTLALWRTGSDLRSLLARNTFYRARNDLLSAIGVDIAVPPQTSHGETVSDLPAPEALNPAGWDPEPIARHFVEPSRGIVTAYGARS